MNRWCQNEKTLLEFYSQKPLDVVNSRDRTIKSSKKHPICVLLDISENSHLESADLFFGKVPFFGGQCKRYLPDSEIVLSVCGDAHSDAAPLQVGNFGDDVDDNMRDFLRCFGGSLLDSEKAESYELGAYYFANKCTFPNAELPFMFIIGDEAPYSVAERSQIKECIGDDVPEDISSKEIFDKLFKKFDGNVFVLLNKYLGYGNPSIINEWKKILGDENFKHLVKIEQEYSVVDLMLGIIALRSGKTLEDYAQDMDERGQTKERIDNVIKILSGL